MQQLKFNNNVLLEEDGYHIHLPNTFSGGFVVCFSYNACEKSGKIAALII